MIARRPWTGFCLVGSAVLVGIGYAVLGSQFGWPDVLDEPGTTALDRYLAAETAIRWGFYAMVLSSLVLIPAAFGLQAAFSVDHTPARVITAFGVLGAFAQLLGWLRWIIAVPVQADLWTAAATDESKRYTVATAYDTLNAYAGGTLGEHLGWLLQGIWAVGFGVIVLRARGVPRGMSATGLAVAAAWAALVPIGTASGISAVETIGVALYTMWYVWLTALGVLVMARSVGPVEHAVLSRGGDQAATA